MKYAIKVPFEDDGLYVTEPDSEGNPVVVTYDTLEEAERVNSTVWNGKGEVVEYHKDALDKLAELRQIMEESREKYEKENDAWWDGLTEKEREDAFYAVVKRICKAELQDRGSYRYVLYNVFGFDMHMYTRGMECGYIDLHNSIIDEEQKAILREYARKKND